VMPVKGGDIVRALRCWCEALSRLSLARYVVPNTETIIHYTI
jgi:hypothetical protein